MALAILAVGSITIGHTILSILGQSPEFFVAKGMSPIEIALSAILVISGPLILVIPVVIVRLFSRRVAGVLLASIIGVLTGVLALYTLDRLRHSTAMTLVCAATVAVFSSLIYLRSSAARRLIRYLAFSPLVILAVFLLASPSSSLLTFGDTPGTIIKGPVARTPVAIVIFDEMPLATIMQGTGQLAAEAFPSFARLADAGVWYRNAVTNSGETRFAVPSIMTGIHPDAQRLPTATDHPDSLFSALSETHDLRVLESVTAVCAEDRCTGNRMATEEKLRSLSRDLRILLAHIVLPDGLSTDLPPIDESWGNFSLQPSGEVANSTFTEMFGDRLAADRRESFVTFNRMIGLSSAKPPFLLGHFLLPHSHWEFLQDGTRIVRRRMPAFVDKVPVDDPWRVSLGVQRYLHTARYVDRALGAIIDELKEAGYYEDALIVVVADHGNSFIPGFPRRTPVPENMAQIAPVPLIVKYPSRYKAAPPPGSVDDVRAEVNDIVPTVFDILGAGVPYALDGLSLLDGEARSARAHSVITLGNGRIRYPVGLELTLEAGAEYDANFPTRNPRELIPPGANPALIGSRPEVVDSVDIRIGVAEKDQYESVHLDEEPFPAVVAAAIEGAEPGDLVGILVDGVIVTLTRVHKNDAGEAEAIGLIPKEAFKAGHNDVRVVLIRGDGSFVG